MRIFILLLTCFLSLSLAACSEKPTETSQAMESPYFQASDHILEVDGLDVRYRDEGPREAQPLLMVHGFTSSLETWDALAENLNQDYRVIRLDLSGHGLTGPDPQSRYSNADTVAFLNDFINTLDLKNPVLIGNSLGGLVSWRLAEEYPEKVSKLVLISPGGFSINGVTDTPVSVPMILKLYLTKAPMAGVKQATTALYADPAKLTEKRLTTLHDMMLQPGNGEAFVARLEQFTLPDPSSDLAKVSAPTLIIWGQKDKMISVDQANQFLEAMPNATLKFYDNAGHVPQEETPDQLATDIRGFLESSE